MAESETKRPRRTPQERAAAVDEKIAKFNQSIAELEEKKTAALAEYDAKITALQERVKALEAKKQEILAPKPPASPVRRKSRRSRRSSSRPSRAGCPWRMLPASSRLKSRNEVP